MMRLGIFLITDAPENDEDVEDRDGGGGEYTSEAHKFWREGTSCFVFALEVESSDRSGGAGSGSPSSIIADV